ncbi:MAG: hypothetical protein ACJ74E_07540 [Actinomycetes bacterium]
MESSPFPPKTCSSGIYSWSFPRVHPELRLDPIVTFPRSSRIAAVLTCAGLLALGACTDTGGPDAAPGPRNSSVQSTDAAAEQADPDALLSAAQAALRDAEAVRVSSLGLVARDTDVTTTRWRAVWSSDPQVWLAASTYHGVPGKRYTHQWRYRRGDLEQRFTLGQAPVSAWYPSSARSIGIDRGDVRDYPVAVLLRATAVDAIPLGEGAIIRAEVPNHLADRRFGVTGLLNESGLPRVLRGGTTEVDITIDASGFPVKAAYSGDDMELTSDVPDYMLENMAASQLTAYYKPIALPENLQK